MDISWIWAAVGEDKREIERDALSTAKQMLRARLSRRLRSDELCGRLGDEVDQAAW